MALTTAARIAAPPSGGAGPVRIRNGLVRCGACSTVFDGRASLVQPADVPGRQAEMPVAMPAATAAGRRAGPCGSSLGSARDSDCPGFRAGAAVGRRACFLAIPARPWAQPPSRRRPPLRSREQIRRQAQDQDARADELDDDELLDDELHDDESQDDEPRAVVVTARTGMMMRAAGATVLMSAIRTRVPRRHDSRSVAARRS